MIESEIERLLRIAPDQPGLQPVLFRALLDATLYALMPPSGQGPADGRIRFLQWARPDGVTVIPCFASELKARLSAQSNARVAAIDGRQLMEVTRGATLHLDPNDFSCELSPADINSMLAHGSVIVPEQEVVVESGPMGFTAPESPPAAMLRSLSVLYDKLGVVQQGFLVEVRAPETPEEVCMLLIALQLDPGNDPQLVVNDSTTVIQDTYHGPLAIDLIVLADTSEVFRTIQGSFPPFYSRQTTTRQSQPGGKLQ